MDYECNRNKRHYDISMSKRTRKPLILDGNYTSSVTPLTSDHPIGDILDETNQKGTLSSPNDDVLDKKDQRSTLAAAIQEEKQLIDGNAKEKERSIEASKCRSSLGQHFTEEEKQLQLVRKQKQGSEGAKLKGMVCRYAKVLSHLIRIKRDSHISGRKKPVIRLSK